MACILGYSSQREKTSNDSSRCWPPFLPDIAGDTKEQTQHSVKNSKVLRDLSAQRASLRGASAASLSKSTWYLEAWSKLLRESPYPMGGQSPFPEGLRFKDRQQVLQRSRRKKLHLQLEGMKLKKSCV